MLKVIVSGCLGKMGEILTKCVQNDSELELVCGCSLESNSTGSSFPIYNKMADISEACNVVIDFSHHSTIDDVLSYCLKNKTPLVIATTGYSDDDLDKIKGASNIIPIFHSSNMSLGVNVLVKLVKDACKMLPGFDIEVIEKHHNRKVDAPSGTAIMITNGIKEVLPNLTENYGRCGTSTKREKNEIGVHAIRGGTIVGEHNVLYAGHDEVIELKHIAQSREVFANGSIVAAKYLVNQQPGYYNMNSMLS